jgi:tRNA (cmo5U34)-methyltransferase
VDTFDASAWAKEEFSRNYLERADIYVPDRRKMIGIVSSLFAHAFKGEKGVRVLDLGCGDGVLTDELLKKGGAISSTLVDGSPSMLEKAGERLRGRQEMRFINASFQEILEGKVTLGNFDFCISSLAIHHLDMDGKAALFSFIAGHLNSGGRFVNIDSVLPPSDDLENWYFAFWKEWMRNVFDRLEVRDEMPEDVIGRYKDPSSMNRPDTLEAQLAALRDAGFMDVDCYYKNGVFAVFGGRKKNFCR